MRTVNDMITELHNAKCCSVIDATKGCWHIPLNKESSMLTTFNTPFGQYRFTQMPFGLHVSQDIFQRELNSSLERLAPLKKDLHPLRLNKACLLQAKIKLKP